MARIAAALASIAAAAAAVSASTTAAPAGGAGPDARLHKRCGGCSGFYPYGGFGYGGLGYGGLGYGGYGYGGLGYGGFGGFFPFASSVTNDFDANNNFAHFNDNTLYVNNKDATAANNNVHSFNNANVVA